MVKNIHGDIYAVAAGYRSQIHDTGIEEKTSYIPNTDYIQPFGPLLASRNLATLNTTVYNLSTFRQEYKVPEGAYLITDGPESKLCLYSRSNGTGYRITLHDIRLNRERWTVNSDEFIVLAHILREGNILTLGLSGKLSLWNSAGQPLASAETRPLPLGNYAKLTVSPDQSQFLIHNWDLSHIAIRSVKSLEVVKVFDGPQVRPLDSSYSPDGSQLAIATMDGLVRVYDVRSGQNTHALAGHLSTVASVEFMPGGREIASIDDNGWLRIWPLHQKSAVRTYPLELHPLRAGRISSDERIVVGHSMDGEFASMDIKSGTVFRKRIEQVKRYPASVYLGHDRIYVGTQEGYLQAVGLPRLETISNTKISEYSINRIWAALQNKVLLLECMSKTDAEYVVVSVPRLDVLTRFRLAKAFNPNILPSVTTSYHEKIGIFGFRTGEIFVHSLVTGRETRKLSIPRGFYSMARARLGKAVAIFKGSEAGVRRFEVVLLDLSNGKIIGTYMADMLPSLVLASHDEDRILLAIDDSGAAHFWDAETFRYLYRVFPGGRVYSVNFSADGRRFVVSSGSGMTTIHDSRSGEQLLNLSYEPLKGSTPPTGVLGDYASFMGTNDKVTMNCLDGAVRVFDSLPRQAPKPAPRTDISRKPERGTPPSSPKNPTAARPR
ncbi:MAG TPA: WD40 repeat domain-containing protein [Fimbriimonadaceae bacterium]|nr:WD40 repeat domain-containing protein [Fimbriimonadaceae bacterium]